MGGYLTPFRTGLMTSAAAIVATAAPSPAMAQTRNFDVPAQAASRGIPTFARQANIQILASGSVVRNRRTNAVRGSLSVDEGLRQLLAGTGLEASRGSGSGIITVREIPAWTTPTSGEAQAAGAAADSEGADAGATPEILVIGSRSQNVDIRRGEDDPQPYVVFGANEIEQSNASNLEEFLRRRLPMNTQGRSFAQNPTAVQGNVSQINLRGLGVNQTLILVDGRRAPRVPLNSSQTISQADINGIPLEAIERVEVLPSTAGGIYGGGAVGGVINIIRKRDYQGLTIRLGTDGTFRGGGESLRLEMSGGLNLEGGKTQISFSASHVAFNPLYVSDNSLWRAGRLLWINNDPTHLSFAGYTPNIRSSNGSNLVLDDGTLLNANHTFVPVGYSGISSDGGIALVANAGRYNIDLSDDVFGRGAALMTNPRVRSANVNLRRSFGNAVDIYADATISDNFARAPLIAAQAVTTIAAASPNNPFRQNIQVFYPLVGVDRNLENHSKTLSATGGALVRFGGSWTAVAEYGWSRARFQNTFTSSALTPAGSTAVANGTVDVIRDLNAFSIDFTPYLAEFPNFFGGPFDTILNTISARVSGFLLSLPGGPLTMSALLERRSEVADSSQNLTDGLTIVYPRRRQSVASAYLEITAPLVSAANGIPLIREFELQASVRRDRYETMAAAPSQVIITSPSAPPPTFLYSTTTTGSDDFTVAVRWAPIASLSLRASYGTGFLPPAISQLVDARGIQSTPISILDPRRGNTRLGEQVPYLRISGGNPGLEPEQSKALSAGVIFNPPFIDGLRISVDFTQIKKTGEIIAPQGAFLLANESLFPDRIIRGAPLPTDPPGWAGPVIQLNTGLINIAKSTVRAIDVQANYTFNLDSFGDFNLYSVATYQSTFRRQPLPSSVSFDTTGYSDGPLRLRLNAGVDWSIGAWSFSWNTQYYNGYSVRNGDPSLAANSDAAVILQGAERIPSQTYHDVNLRYRFDARSGWLNGLELSAGILNLFDSRPPPIALPLYGYSPYGDPRLRRYALSVRKQFGR